MQKQWQYDSLCRDLLWIWHLLYTLPKQTLYTKRTLQSMGIHQRGNSKYEDWRRCVWTYVPLNKNWSRVSLLNVLKSTVYSCINTYYRTINYVLNRVSVTNQIELFKREVESTAASMWICNNYMSYWFSSTVVFTSEMK